MGFFRTCALAMALSVGCVVGGCAGDNQDDATQGDDQNVSASAPITVGNFISHPKIKAIRNEVRTIQTTADAKMDKKDNSCGDGTGTAKFTNAAGRIRKVNWFAPGGSIEYFYRDNGKVLFIFSSFTDFNGTSAHVREHRVYFDDNNRVMFEVTRDGPKADIADEPHQKPTEDEGWVVSDLDTDPNLNFETAGCERGH